MNSENLRQDLYQKMKNELNIYIKYLKKESVDRIIDRSYELSMKKEFLDLFQPDYIQKSFTDLEIKTLLSVENPLQELYSSWICCDLTYFDILEESSHDTINDLKEYYSFQEQMQTAEKTRNNINANAQKNVSEQTYEK